MKKLTKKTAVKKKPAKTGSKPAVKKSSTVSPVSKKSKKTFTAKPVKKIAEKKPVKKSLTVAKVSKKKSAKKTSQPKVSKLKASQKTSKKVDQASSMEELLAKTGYQLRAPKKNTVIKAVLTDKGKRTAYFDIGAKTEGIIIGKELEFVKDYIDKIDVGTVLEAKVVIPENEKGQILLSLREAAFKWKWDLLEDYYKKGEPVEVRGLDVNRGGMIARIMDIRGFIPTSQFGYKWTNDLDSLYNKVFPVKIIEVDREKNRLIFSEKAVSEAESLKKQEEAALSIKKDKIYTGEIGGIMPFGLFVKIAVKVKEGGKSKKIFLDGLVHISQVSWEKIDDLKKLYKVGDKIKVKVIEVNKKTNKLNLSIKQLQADPWEDLAKKYKKEKKFKGVVTRLAAFGAFVRLEAGIEGLIHISKIPTDQKVKVGDKLDVYVESLDLKQRRISLGIMLSAKPVGYK